MTTQINANPSKLVGTVDGGQMISIMHQPQIISVASVKQHLLVCNPLSGRGSHCVLCCHRMPLEYTHTHNLEGLTKLRGYLELAVYICTCVCMCLLLHTGQTLNWCGVWRVDCK